MMNIITTRKEFKKENLSKYFLPYDIRRVKHAYENALCRGKHTGDDITITCMNCDHVWCMDCSEYLFHTSANTPHDEVFIYWKDYSIRLTLANYRIKRNRICHICQGKLCDICDKMVEYIDTSEPSQYKCGSWEPQRCQKCKRKYVCLDCKLCFDCRYDIRDMWMKNTPFVVLFEYILSEYFNILPLTVIIISYIDIGDISSSTSQKVVKLLELLEPIQK